MLPRLFAFILLVSIPFITASAQTIKGVWQRTDSLELIEEGVFAAASDQVAYYIGLDKGWKTTNGGLAWTPLTFPSTMSIGPSSIFTNGSTVTVLQQRFDQETPMVIRSNDEGATWEVVNDSFMNDNLKAVSIWSPTGIHIISVNGLGAGKSYISNDGGISFQEGRSDATLEKYIATSLSGSKRYTLAAAWSDSLNGIISLTPRNIDDPPAHILVTHDAGASWKEMLLPNRNDVTAIPGKVYTLQGTPYIWVNVTDFTRPGCYYFSTDFGETWRVSQTVERPLELLSPVDTSTIWGLFSAFQYPELNQNKTFVNQGVDQPWSQIMGLPAGNRALSVNYLKFFSADKGWATGTRVNQTGTLYYYIYRFVPQSSVAAIEQPQISVFPLPAGESTTIRIERGEWIKRYAIRDILGKDVTAKTLSTERAGELTLDLRQLNAGTYVVTIGLTSGKEVTTTISKQ